MKSLWNKMLLLAGIGLGANSQASAAEVETAPPAPPNPPIIAILEGASRDLQMPSETDAPFRAFFLPQTGETDAAKIAETLELKHRDFKEERTLEEFFDAAATVEDWMDDEEKSRANRFAALRDLLEKELKNPRVWLFGETEMDAVIFGEIEGGTTGLVTLVVET